MAKPKQEESIEKQLWKAATSNEGEIRKALIETNLIDCIVNLPAKLFLNTQIPASIWFAKRGRTTKDILFIDSRNMGELINRRTKEFSHEDTDYIAKVYQNWKTGNSEYADIKGFCKSASQEEVKEQREEEQILDQRINDNLAKVIYE